MAEDRGVTLTPLSMPWFTQSPETGLSPRITSLTFQWHHSLDRGVRWQKNYKGGLTWGGLSPRWWRFNSNYPRSQNHASLAPVPPATLPQAPELWTLHNLAKPTQPYQPKPPATPQSELPLNKPNQTSKQSKSSQKHASLKPPRCPKLPNQTKPNQTKLDQDNAKTKPNWAMCECASCAAFWKRTTHTTVGKADCSRRRMSILEVVVKSDANCWLIMNRWSERIPGSCVGGN